MNFIPLFLRIDFGYLILCWSWEGCSCSCGYDRRTFLVGHFRLTNARQCCTKWLHFSFYSIQLSVPICKWCFSLDFVFRRGNLGLVCNLAQVGFRLFDPGNEERVFKLLFGSWIKLHLIWLCYVSSISIVKWKL